VNIALVLAGGLGQRMNSDSEPPKQFFVLGDKPVLIHTLERFELYPEIDAICVVCLPTWENYLRDMIKSYGHKKTRWIVKGGDTRQASVYYGLLALEKECSPDDMILVHDGVRPFITHGLIQRNIKTAQEYANAMTGARSTDTLVKSKDGISADSSMERSSMFSIQTPQTYKLGYGLDLYKRAYESGITEAINCCELFIEMGEKIYIVIGRKSNIKLTTRDDINYLKYLNIIFNERIDSEA